MLSLYRIDLIFSGGRTVRLVEFLDSLVAEIPLPVSIAASDYAEVGADWANGVMEGAAKRSLAFQVRRKHATHKDLRSFCMRHPESFPKRETAKVHFSIIDADLDDSSPEVWELSGARLAACEPAPLRETGDFETVTAYRLETMSARPISVIDPFPGIPWTWLNQPWTSLTQPWTSY
jgi:hypothetical protein